MPANPERTGGVQSSFLRDDDLARGRDGDRKVPVPMIGSEIIHIESACWYADVCDKTIREWAKLDGIGRQAGKSATLKVSLPALLMKVDGQLETLERLRSGDRDHPSVEFYLRRAIRLQEEARVGAERRRLESVRAEMRLKTST
ncbi:hypothetical protein EPK99_25010 [Neorhizobium lilium]|uniref:Uncharacterized protein n=1 Tax=Neorhizobium lilium TaxID=2503024 RepID=A0A3S3RPA4_9HYPH|nr:hypothetical protein [Neorhizobium lilium]RWX74447.1 hypothetical protein EPK99_25010 [Neorhizobium lilium]